VVDVRVVLEANRDPARRATAGTLAIPEPLDLAVDAE
jgi:hypothetical protein